MPSKSLAERIADRLTTELTDFGVRPPDSVVNDPNGGIVFTYDMANGGEAELHVWDDGDVDLCIFKGTRLVSRHNISDLAEAVTAVMNLQAEAKRAD